MGAEDHHAWISAQSALDRLPEFADLNELRNVVIDLRGRPIHVHHDGRISSQHEPIIIVTSTEDHVIVPTGSIVSPTVLELRGLAHLLCGHPNRATRDGEPIHRHVYSEAELRCAAETADRLAALLAHVTWRESD